MDSYAEYPSEFDTSSSETAPPQDVAAAIGTDERRMHVRAYNHWVSLLEGRDFPSIEDLEPGDVTDFAAHSVLLDFTCGRDNPAVPYIGAAIREECGLSEDAGTIADVPSRSLLSRLTDHYLQIIANRAPIGFEAEYLNQRDETICYRGILMPFSSDGDTIDFIYGVINWKHVEASAAANGVAAEPPLAVSAETQIDAEAEAEAEAVAEPQVKEPLELTDSLEHSVAALPDAAADVDLPAIMTSDEEALPEVELDADAGLADRLWAARETAEAVKAGEGRTRSALYRALALAYDFALATRECPEDYAELLLESGVKAQERAPMTPIVKLVFGIDYDKARLTEFAAALSYAVRQQVDADGFQQLIESTPGGLKALVAAERQARKPSPKRDTKGEEARARLRTAAPLSLADFPAGEEFAVVITRRGADGGHEPVAVLDDEALIERAIRRAA